MSICLFNKALACNLISKHFAIDDLPVKPVLLLFDSIKNPIQDHETFMCIGGDRDINKTASCGNLALKLILTIRDRRTLKDREINQGGFLFNPRLVTL